MTKEDAIRLLKEIKEWADCQFEYIGYSQSQKDQNNGYLFAQEEVQNFFDGIDLS